MEDVLGGTTDAARFGHFLEDWEAILTRRVDEAVSALAAIEGVHGLILAGSIGRGESWPLSDIDILPIYDGRAEETRAEIARRRTPLLRQWIDEGWWTGIDVGRLAFDRGEVMGVLRGESPALTTLLQDDRWYHSLDKGYRGRAVHDPDGLAADLVCWLTDRRFSSPAVSLRLARARREAAEAGQQVAAHVASGDHGEATKAIREAVKWLRTWTLESWGERDTSLGRVGTRFDRLARDHAQPELAEELNDLSDLDGASIETRISVTPPWVRERHDRSWCARRHIGEAVTRHEDARDTLRVCSQYEMRRFMPPPFPAWLAVPIETATLEERAARLTALIGSLSSMHR